MIEITRELLARGMGRDASWGDEQLKALGIEVPPTEGWRARIIGSHWPESDVNRFLELKDAHLSTELKDLQATTTMTLEILEAGKSTPGGWSAAQLAVFGIDYPLPAGWKRRLVGSEWPQYIIDHFLNLKDAHLPGTSGTPRTVAAHPGSTDRPGSNAEEFRRKMQAAGRVTDSRPMVGFLYRLLRDHIQPSVVEELEDVALAAVRDGRDGVFTNVRIAQYAQDLADRLAAPAPAPDEYRHLIDREYIGRGDPAFCRSLGAEPMAFLNDAIRFDLAGDWPRFTDCPDCIRLSGGGADDDAG